MNPTHNTNIAVVLVLGVALGLAFGYFFATVVQKGTPIDIVGTAPLLAAEQKTGATPLTPEETQAVAAHRSAIVARVRSGTPLTDVERGAVARAVLDGGTLYDFSVEEVALLNRALQQ